MRFLFYLIVVVLGTLSMGFQLLASRLLAPHFGSSIIVWAWLISTFLSAFSLGSMLGGWISNAPAAQRERLQSAAAAVGILALAVTAFFARPLLDRIEISFMPLPADGSAEGAGMNTALFVSCLSLFFVPVTALSSFGPQCVNFLAARGTAPGAASGVVYGASTFGNIAGVMLTAFVLIPNEHLGMTRLLYLWLAVAIVSLVGLIRLLRTTPTPLPP
jgi:hypothetical protein